jgi:Domain of unknown function (DUF1707)
MDRAGWNYPPGDFRVSDADRDRALAELTEAFHVGRITADEWDQRSGLSLGARTGAELTALLADLPAEHEPATRASTVDRARRVQVASVSAVAAVAAFCFAAAAAGAAVSSTGPTLQEREFAQAVAASQGMAAPVFPPNSGFDWAGTMTPGTIAVLLVVLIIYLRVRLTRADHP